MIVVDASVFIDFYSEDENRKSIASSILSYAEKFVIYEPKLFIIELLCVLSRKRKDALEIVREIRSKIVEVKEEEIFDTAYDLAPVVRGRAADLYYIATARLTGSILISSDQIQVKNAKRANIEAYYTLKETDKLLEKLKQMLSASKPLER